jgi:hypothetical protein
MQALRRAHQFRTATGGAQILCFRFRRGTTRLYFVAMAAAHELTITAKAHDFVQSAWGDHFDLLPVV